VAVGKPGVEVASSGMVGTAVGVSGSTNSVAVGPAVTVGEGEAEAGTVTWTTVSGAKA
jgi:hypothetical protein